MQSLNLTLTACSYTKKYIPDRDSAVADAPSIPHIMEHPREETRIFEAVIRLQRLPTFSVTSRSRGNALQQDWPKPNRPELIRRISLRVYLIFLFLYQSVLSRSCDNSEVPRA